MIFVLCDIIQQKFLTGDSMKKVIKILFLTSILMINSICLAESNEAEKYFKLATQSFNEQKYHAALENFNKALQLGYTDESLFEMRAITFLNLNKVDETIEDCNQVLKLNPKNSAAYQIRGAAYLLIYDYDSVLDNYRASLAINSNDEDLKKQIAEIEKLKLERENNVEIQIHDYSDVAYRRFKENKFDIAIELYTKILELNPNYFYALRLRGASYAVTDRIDLAIADWERSLQFDPDDDLIKDWLKKAYEQKKK